MKSLLYNLQSILIPNLNNTTTSPNQIGSDFLNGLRPILKHPLIYTLVAGSQLFKSHQISSH